MPKRKRHYRRRTHARRYVRAHNRRRSNPSHYLTRHNPRHYRRRRHSFGFLRPRHRRGHNPDGVMSTERLIPMLVGGAGGFFGARLIPQNIPFLVQYNTGITGYALNAASGFAVSWLLKFWKRDAFVGGLVGTGLAVIARVITDQNPANAGSSMSGDLDFDLGYYTSDRFPFPQGPGGPYQQFPGTPYLSNPPFQPTGATAVAAGQAAAAAALPAAAAAPAAAKAHGMGADRWGSRW